MKKLLSIALALLLVCTLSLSVFAADTGSITITGLVEDADYEIYQLLDLKTYDSVKNKYFYTVNADWTAFFALADTQTYVTVDPDDGHVEWKTGADAAAFAQKALAYAEANTIDPVKTTADMAVTGTTGVFSNLPLGYYLVDSSVGALCNLTTTKPDAEIAEKNTVPSVEKETESASASIGQIVNFTVTITVGSGAENYVLHDKMTAGLTFVHDVANDRGVLSVKLNGTALTEGVDYNVVIGGDSCTFDVAFTKAGMDKMTTGDEVVVSYNAQINADAVVHTAKNEAHLEYGDDMTDETTSDTTETKLYSIDLIKTDGDNKLLDGAEFKLYDASTGGNEIKVVKVSEGVYRPALESEVPVDTIVVKDGKVTIQGLGAGTYYLEETVVPAGYNKLSERQAFTIVDANLSAEFVGDVYTPGTGVQVINKTGNQLPETGGMGTVIFVVVGTLAVLGAGVLLVTKKRMSMIEE